MGSDSAAVAESFASSSLLLFFFFAAAPGEGPMSGFSMYFCTTRPPMVVLRVKISDSVRHTWMPCPLDVPGAFTIHTFLGKRPRSDSPSMHDWGQTDARRSTACDATRDARGALEDDDLDDREPRRIDNPASVR